MYFILYFYLLNLAALTCIENNGCSLFVQQMNINWLLMLTLQNWQNVFILSFIGGKKTEAHELEMHSPNSQLLGSTSWPMWWGTLVLVTATKTSATLLGFFYICDWKFGCILKDDCFSCSDSVIVLLNI